MDGASTRVRIRGVRSLDSLRTNLACEATDTAPWPLHSSAVGDWHHSVSPGHCSTITQRYAGLRRRQRPGTETRLPNSRTCLRHGLPTGTRHARLLPVDHGASAEQQHVTRACTALKGRGGAVTLPAHRCQGLATWQMPSGTTLNPLLPCTGGGLVPFVLLHQWAGNERVEIG